MSPRHLSRTTLAGLPGAIARPAYDLSAVRTGILHIGPGAFHRAHQANYVDECLAAGESDWGICGVSLRSSDTVEALAAQDHLYTLATRAPGNNSFRIIGSIHETLAAHGDMQTVLRRLDDPAIRIVSLTITEKGYGLDSASGLLDISNREIRADIASPNNPQTAPGLLVEALRRRRAARLAPFAILSCDNLSDNGHKLHAALVALAQQNDSDLAKWIVDDVACPSTMVDRIAPAPRADDLALVEAALGVHDAAPVVCEPFRQWVIEDCFSNGRPQFERGGAMLVASVAPYELAKLRLLNGTHSALAWLGYLAGYETIAETIADPDFAGFAGDLMSLESAPTLAPLTGFDLAQYQRDLLARFANPALRHRTWQIAMDSTQKLPPRLLASLRDSRKTGAPTPRRALAIAAWMRYAYGVDERGNAIDIRDPLRDKMQTIAAAAGPDAARLAPAFLGLRDVFGDDLPRDLQLVASLTFWLRQLFEHGARRTLRDFNALVAQASS